MANRKIYTLEEIKITAKDVFAKYDSVKYAYLFGSYARGEAREDSDIDFLIYINNEDDVAQKKQYIAAGGHLNIKFDKEIDILLPCDIKNNECLRKNIERDKVLVYEREN